MTTHHTEALLLRSVDFAEADRILHLLTPATGRITVIARHARRSAKRFSGNLDFFNHLDVQIEQRRTGAMARLDSARLRRTFHGFRSSPGRFALGCYLLELIDRLAPEGGARSERAKLFRFVLAALAWLDGAALGEGLRPLLEFRTLDALGLRPGLLNCVLCNRELTRADGPRIGFRIEDGGPCCRLCPKPPGPPGLQLHLGTLRALDGALRFDLSKLGRLALTPSAVREARELLWRFLRFHVGPPLHSERYLDDAASNGGAGRRPRPAPPGPR